MDATTKARLAELATSACNLHEVWGEAVGQYYHDEDSEDANVRCQETMDAAKVELDRLIAYINSLA